MSSLLPAPFARALTRRVPDTDRIAEYEMKLMDIDVDTLNIPDTDYDARVTMPSSEFGRIVRDLVNADGRGFLIGLGLWFALAVPSTYTNTMVCKRAI